MKKYYLVGEDIARREITADEAREYVGDSDYRVIVEEDGHAPRTRRRDLRRTWILRGHNHVFSCRDVWQFVSQSVERLPSGRRNPGQS